MTKQKPKFTNVKFPFPEGATVKEIMNWIHGDDIRTKGDLVGWTGSPPMHLNREPVATNKKK